MKSIFATLLLFSALFVKGQEYYASGTAFLKAGDCNSADSLFSLSITKGYRNANVYFNRGLARLCLQDSTGFCSDMEVASDDYLDDIAAANFNLNCSQTVDTIYYNRKHTVVDKSKYRFYEIVKKHRYDSLITGSVYDAKFTETGMFIYLGDNGNLKDILLRKTHRFAYYQIRDTLKYYLLSNNPPYFKKKPKYTRLMLKGGLFLGKKYSYLKKENGLDNLHIIFRFLISPTGEIVKKEFVTTQPSIDVDGKEKELTKDINTIFLKYSKVVPGTFWKKKVYFMYYDSIDI